MKTVVDNVTREALLVTKPHARDIELRALVERILRKHKIAYGVNGWTIEFTPGEWRGFYPTVLDAIESVEDAQRGRTE